MSTGINSLSSSMMFGITLYRNHPGISNKVMAQAGYALTAMVAVAETVAALACTVFSLFSPTRDFFDHSVQWSGISAFSFMWSITDFCLNPFVKRLVADESSAIQMFQDRDLITIPYGAVL